jgi:hypothetical protein
MDVSRVYAFILCLCCPVFRSDELITRPRSPTVCEKIKKPRNRPYALMYNRPICGRSTGTYTNLGDLQRDLRGLSPTPPKKNALKWE